MTDWSNKATDKPVTKKIHVLWSQQYIKDCIKVGNILITSIQTPKIFLGSTSTFLLVLCFLCNFQQYKKQTPNSFNASPLRQYRIMLQWMLPLVSGQKAKNLTSTLYDCRWCSPTILFVVTIPVYHFCLFDYRLAFPHFRCTKSHLAYC